MAANTIPMKLNTSRRVTCIGKWKVEEEQWCHRDSDDPGVGKNLKALKWPFKLNFFFWYSMIYLQPKILGASLRPHCWRFWRHLWTDLEPSQRVTASCQCKIEYFTLSMLNRGIAAVSRSMNASPLSRILLNILY